MKRSTIERFNDGSSSDKHGEKPPEQYLRAKEVPRGNTLLMTSFLRKLASISVTLDEMHMEIFNSLAHQN